jgi:hypothetical protein
MVAFAAVTVCVTTLIRPLKNWDFALVALRAASNLCCNLRYTD